MMTMLSTFVLTLFRYDHPATVLFRYTNGDLNHLICDPNTYLTNLTIEKGEFLARCKQLCNILQYEFYFYKVRFPVES